MKFSIIIPVRNCIEYLERSIYSIVAQNFKSYEIIIVDDGSTDGTLELARKMSESNSHIRVISQIHLGVSVARNKAIKSATGDYLIFCDADDWYEDNALNILSKIIDEDDYDIIFFAYYKYFKDKSKVLHKYKDYKDKSFSDKSDFLSIQYYIMNAINPGGTALFLTLWTGCYKREFVVKNELQMIPNLQKSEDQLFNLECLDKVSKIRYTPIPLYNYFYNPQSACNRIREDIVEIQEFFMKELKKYIQENHSDDAIFLKGLYDWSYFSLKSILDNIKTVSYSNFKKYLSKVYNSELLTIPLKKNYPPKEHRKGKRNYIIFICLKLHIPYIVYKLLRYHSE